MEAAKEKVTPQEGREGVGWQSSVGSSGGEGASEVSAWKTKDRALRRERGRTAGRAGGTGSGGSCTMPEGGNKELERRTGIPGGPPGKPGLGAGEGGGRGAWPGGGWAAGGAWRRVDGAGSSLQ